MRIKIVFSLLMLPWFVLSQQVWKRQTDSIYKENKVKTIYVFSENKLQYLVNLDKRGQIIKTGPYGNYHNLGLLTGGGSTPCYEFVHWYYQYDERGNLTKSIDTSQTVSLNNGSAYKVITDVLDMEDLFAKFPQQLKNDTIRIASLNHYTYQNMYRDNELIEVKKFYNDKLYEVTQFKNKGGKRVSESYRYKGNKVKEYYEEVYLDKLNVLKSSGWRGSKWRRFKLSHKYEMKENRIVNVRSYSYHKLTSERIFEYNLKGLIFREKYRGIDGDVQKSYTYQYDFY